MTITSIEPRKKGLSALYIDGEFAFKLDSEVLISNRFDVGKDITDEELHDVVLQSDNKRCKDKALWLISFRDYSKKELIQKLRKDYSEEAVLSCVSRLEELSLINDESYATRLSHDLVNIKHSSLRGVREKLREKGIDKDLIDEIVSSLDIDEREQIRIIIEKKYRNLSDEKTRRRCVSALQRMGFSYSDIKSTLNEYANTEDY
ncbi:MAG: regulatory protein RecX [Oscillospiraceae bacterium]|nr:regulatory protein RecX [Candidatus Ruminococcus equi]